VLVQCSGMQRNNGTIIMTIISIEKIPSTIPGFWLRFRGGGGQRAGGGG
jgi:hypothetical protein